MPTEAGNPLNAICLRCGELEVDQPERRAGFCVRTQKDKSEIFKLIRCEAYDPIRQDEYEKRLGLLDLSPEELMT